MSLTTQDVSLNLLELIPEPDWLMRTAEENSQEYRSASPYQHIIFDNFLPEAVAQAALNAFPSPHGEEWHRFKTEHEVKLARNQELAIPSPIRNLLFALNSATFLRFLEALTGIEGLIPDPQLLGGGMHQIVAGGKLGIHVDFNKHPRTRLDRRLNLLIYLNRDWEEEYGGHFELWDTQGKECRQRVLPLFNRCVIFSTTEVSYHGHPHPLRCPPDRSRKSLALYYYSNGRPAEEMGAKHSTLWLDTNSSPSLWSKVVRTSKKVARELTPPLLQRLVRR